MATSEFCSLCPAQEFNKQRLTRVLGGLGAPLMGSSAQQVIDAENANYLKERGKFYNENIGTCPQCPILKSFRPIGT